MASLPQVFPDQFLQLDGVERLHQVFIGAERQALSMSFSLLSVEIMNMGMVL